MYAGPRGTRSTAISPLAGGPEGTGWPFGRPVHAYELSAVLAQVPGVGTVDEVLIFPADLATRRRGDPTSRLDIGDNALILSYQHQVRVI